MKVAVVAALVLAAPAARAQDDVLRARDLRGAAPRLYDAITQLRPTWLQLADPAATERIAVYVNGRYLGDARVLRTIETAQVTSARLRSSATVRAMDLPLPPNEFDVAVDVATRPLERPAAPGRVTLSLDAGVDLRSLAHGVRGALADAGYDREKLQAQAGTTQFDGTQLPVTLGAAVHYAVRGPWGVQLVAQHTLEGVGGGYSRERIESVSAAVTSTEAALLVSRDSRAVRLSAGPVFRQVDWSWARGFCRCEEPETDNGSAVGVAGEGRVTLPYGRRVSPAFRVMARYYPSQTSSYSVLTDEVDAGGLVITTSLSVATRF
jgi:hypothetical protein